MRLTTNALGIALAVMALPASAQVARQPSAYDLALAAGYKATITCGAVFVAGRSEAQIAVDELAGIYPEYAAIVPTLTATIDQRSRAVSVPFAPDLPPRIAIWSARTGCTTLPIGTPVQAMPAPASGTPGPAGPAQGMWPRGDALPNTALLPLEPVARAFDPMAYGRGTKTTGVVVVKANQIIAEQYAPGFGPFTAQRTWSVAKSMTGTLAGMAVLAGAVKVDQPVAIAVWADPRDPRRTITLDNLLRMASGLHSDTAGNRTDAIYFGGTGVQENVAQWPLEAKPGTRFRYANNDILLAMLSIRARLGEARYKFFPHTALFAKLGMRHSFAEADLRGDYILSSRVWTTARDLARFGQFYLNDGVWNGERLLPTGWVKYVTTPSGPQPPGDFGYGATFWLINKSPGVPADTYSANGNRGQFVVIVPSRGIVIVRRGEDPGSFDIAKFTADVLAAVK
ncbi:serine hydrolase [Sphingomonas sp. 32-62-10]|uniref:serine hydrolase domain-containing protein n=1 Tax=Sphingomonas sp. 32-62-10 TaxID=1970436 RepID=UPI000BDC8FCA|nr:MAG: serine hydrolase [Sphingomonas sp. 12-62-6]OYX40516.1 MAG: serine hydrolase [Sphingomonas sp. 32-62-10]